MEKNVGLDIGLCCRVHDGIPDVWEKKFGLNLDDAYDKDGDGYTNIEEWLNATDPTQYVDYTNPANNTHSLLGKKAFHLIVLQSNTYKHYIQRWIAEDSEAKVSRFGGSDFEQQFRVYSS